MAHVIIIGAGVAGMSCAFELKAALGAAHRVTVVGEGPKFSFTPSNPWVAVGWRRPKDVQIDATAALSKRGIAFVHVVEGATRDARDYLPFDYQALRKAFRGAYIANNGFTRELAIETVEKGEADLIAFGRLFIANPDLPERLKLDAPLNTPDVATFYGGDAKGYTDYPALAPGEAVQAAE